MIRANSDTLIIVSSKLYTAAVSIVLLPILLEHLGSEQYGLIGAFVVIQACIQILDAGISGTLTRQSIITQVNYVSFELFIKKAELVFVYFLCLTVAIAYVGFELSNLFAKGWFNSELPESLLKQCATLMFLIISIRFFQGPFKSILLSFEKHRLLSTIDIVYATINGPMIVFLLLYYNGDVSDYLILQLIAVFIVLCWIAVCTIRTTSEKLSLLRERIKADDSLVETSLASLIKFGFKLSILSILWVIVNQSDKVVLTTYMPLKDYAFYAIALSLIGLLSIFTSTMIQTVRPRFTSLFNSENHLDMERLLKNSAINLVSILTPLVVFLIAFGHNVIELWTGNSQASQQVMIYLPYLLTGSFFVALSEFSFIILYAKGDLTAHTKFYSLASMIIIPLNIYVASKYLGEGSAKLFMLVNASIFLTWSMYNLHRFFSGAVKLFIVIVSVSLMISLILAYSVYVLGVESDLIQVLVAVLTGAVTIVLCYLALNRCDINIHFKG
ncbi:hypothetical protein BCV02_01455 [Vibrio breoganii]|uniref:Oligosaccharide flippase family protein n=1 Tax=Vibrio breoganii TaxID=553239 RepID=A0AAP8SV12_9VIBR|nr:oligosaccharide flippase family protein [Vibrio breoganii]NMO74124.1 oligosaccharide flippase family protein [Vibrio breoganii]NMR70869.1 oligosaccharide flippase family protein [Vibrio breoganii]PMG02921.1 hypothetical protein BCV02_01455 [Vibrio breoganii]PML88185.1 hypothetical protein BCT67_10760 [Vibrio breoganii]PMP05670.1 hypothetical protein BCS93_18550 [Vibrio breoganii]